MAWQSAAVDISHMGLLRFMSLVVAPLISEFMTPSTQHYKDRHIQWISMSWQHEVTK